MNNKNMAVVLCSGGMDSVTALYHAVAEKQPIAAVVSFDYGSKHNAKEIPFAQYHAHLLGLLHLTIPLKFIETYFQSALLKGGVAIPEGHYEDDVMKQTVVPFRNGIMLSIAAGLAESNEASKLIIAAHAGDHAIYPDCRREFMDKMADAIFLGTYAHIQVEFPFIGYTKSQIVSRAHHLGINLAETWSCYKGERLHCGRCGTCIERREAFHLAGVSDPTIYADDAPTVEELVAKGWKL